MKFVLLCAAVIMINNTKLPWNHHDYQMLDHAKTHCVEEKKCLTKFHKRAENSYFAWCKKQ